MPVPRKVYKGTSLEMRRWIREMGGILENPTSQIREELLFQKKEVMRELERNAKDEAKNIADHKHVGKAERDALEKKLAKKLFANACKENYEVLGSRLSAGEKWKRFRQIMAKERKKRSGKV